MKNQISTFLLLAFSFGIASAKSPNRGACLKNQGTNLVYPKGKKIQIAEYNVPSETYLIFSPEFPGEGNSIVSPESLMKSIKAVRDLKKVLAKKPDDIVDAVYETEADIPTFFEEERDARKKCLGK